MSNTNPPSPITIQWIESNNELDVENKTQLQDALQEHQRVTAIQAAGQGTLGQKVVFALSPAPPPSGTQ